jgi:hypothetical protein
VDLKEKLRLLLKDLLITGYAYYRVTTTDTNVVIEVLDPLNTFVDINPDSNYIRDGYRSVVRKFLTKTQILNKYGQYMQKDDIDSLNKEYDGLQYTGRFYVRNTSDTPTTAPDRDGIDANHAFVPGFPVDESDSARFRLLEVKECEWIRSEKQADGTYLMNRYNTVKIGG